MVLREHEDVQYQYYYTCIIIWYGPYSRNLFSSFSSSLLAAAATVIITAAASSGAANKRYPAVGVPEWESAVGPSYAGK